MRKRNCLLLLAGVATLTLNSCKNDEDAQSSSDMNFEVSFEGDAANQLKTTLVKEKNTYYNSWTSGDQVAITDGSVLSTFQTEVSGRVRALFSRISGDKLSEEEGNTYLAYYPASGCVSYAGDKTFKVTLPRVQYYNENGTVGEGTYPMIGISSSSKMSLYNLAGVLKVNVSSYTPLQIDSISLTSNSRNLWGPASACISDSVPALSMGTENGYNSIRIDLGSGITIDNKGKLFYIVIPPYTYPANDLVLRFYTPYITSKQTYNIEIPIVRSTLRNSGINISVVIAEGEDGKPGVTID